jgi:acetoin utilization deacetylase AcuC-like enzyme
MVTAVFTHPASREHVTPRGHPERVERIEAVEAALDAIPGLDRREAAAAAEAELLRCHPQGYIDQLKAAEPAEGFAALDPDTFMSPGSFAAALHAVGGVCAAVDAVLAGEVANGFSACRPPGHHAERERPMGFCLFGNVAIAAKRALDQHGLKRVAVLDFDVHHGNGTQDLLWDEGRAFFASSHQMPLYPGSGDPGERGAHGQILNVPLAAGSGGREMRAAWEGAILPAAEAFGPELILVSAGFDAHAADPLAGLDWQVEDFRWVTGAICDLAARVSGGRVVSTLEGGYDLEALGASVAAHVEVLKERGG